MTDDFEDSDLDFQDEDEAEAPFVSRTDELDGSAKEETSTEPLIMLEEKQEALGDRWQTGMCLLQIYRDMPINDSKGNKISGKIMDINHRIESDWFEKNVGGGTYHVIIRGPSKKHPNKPGKPILGHVHNIVIAGRPFINNKTPDDDTLQPKNVNDDVTSLMAKQSHRMETLLNEQNKRMEDKLERIERARDEERKQEERRRKENEASMFDAIEHAREREREAAKEAQERNENLFATILKTSNDPEREAGFRKQVEAMQEAARQASDNHVRELRDLAERHREQLDQTRRDFQEQMQSMRNEWSERERTMMSSQAERERLIRDEFDRRERDLRDSAAAREQSLRDEMDRRERGVKDSADKEEKHLLQQISELKEELRTYRDKAENLSKEASEAKFERIKAEMMAAHAQENPGGLMGLAKNMEEFQAVASVLGLSKGEGGDNVMEQVTAVLNTEAAKRVGTGLANVASGLANRGQQPQQLPPPQQMAPPPDALAQWNAMQEQMRQQEMMAQQGGVQRTAVRTRAPQEPVAAPDAAAEAATAAEALAEQHPEPMVDSNVPQEVLDQAMTQQQAAAQVEVPPEQYADEAKKLMELIDAALDNDSSPEEVWNAVEPMFGGNAQMVVMVHPDVAIGRIEQAIGNRLSVRAKKLVKEALAFGKKKYQPDTE